MLKGLFYGYLMAWKTLCTSGAPSGYASYCTRIRTNAAHLADDVRVGQGNNELTGNWLAAVVTGSTTYRLRAETNWVLGKVEIQNNPLTYSDGIIDWSGTHLAFVGHTTHLLLAGQLNLGGDATNVIPRRRRRFVRQHFSASHGGLVGAQAGARHHRRTAGARRPALASARNLVPEGRLRHRPPHPTRASVCRLTRRCRGRTIGRATRRSTAPRLSTCCRISKPPST